MTGSAEDGPEWQRHIGNVLTSTTLEHLPAHDGPKAVYAAGCRFSKARLEREGITFKQTPYAIRTK